MAKDAKWYAGWVRHAYAQTPDEKLTNFETAEFIENLAAELEAVKRERDAAIMDLEGHTTLCSVCKHKEKRCEAWCYQEDFEWRGLCAENGGAEDDA